MNNPVLSILIKPLTALPPIVVGGAVVGVGGAVVLASRVAHARRLSKSPRLVPLAANTRLAELPYGDRRFIVYADEQENPFIEESASDARRNGPLVHRLSSSDTGPQGVNLPPGHPIPGVLYVAHPCSGAYYPAADFHRAVFEQKLGELLKLLSSLGATRIHAEAQYGWGRDFAAKLTLPYLRLATKGDQKGAGEAVFSATWPDRRQHPEIPTGMHWFDSEPIWKANADLVLHHDGTEPLALQWTLEYESNFCLNADAESNFKDLQIGFGGVFHQFSSTRWQVHAEFPERPRHLRWSREWRGWLERVRPRRNIPTLPNPLEGRPHG